ARLGMPELFAASLPSITVPSPAAMSQASAAQENWAAALPAMTYFQSRAAPWWVRAAPLQGRISNTVLALTEWAKLKSLAAPLQAQAEIQRPVTASVFAR